MLNICKKLFDALTNNSVRSFVYKGLEHLEKDLLGDGGDIDLFVEEHDLIKFDEIAKKAGYAKVKETPTGIFYYGLDFKTTKASLIEVVSSIPLGKKPYKKLLIDMVYADFQITAHPKFKNINVLNDIDYVKLMLIIRSSEESLSSGEVQPIIKLRKSDFDIKRKLDSLLVGLFGSNFYCSNHDVEEEHFIEKYHKQKSTMLCKNNNLQASIPTLYKVFTKIKLLLGFPFFKKRRFGRLIAFVGVDGAGKTTVTSRIEKMDYFKAFSLKTMYFGNNDYWIPGLSSIAKLSHYKLVAIPVSLIARVDRQLRIFIALFYMLQGRDVLADRYYYDDLYTLKFNENKEKPRLLDKLKWKLMQVLSVRMIYTPDKTLFMDVSPQVAFSRKQDYAYEKLEKTIDGYRSLLYSRAEVVRINADETLDLVMTNTLKEII